MPFALMLAASQAAAQTAPPPVMPTELPPIVVPTEWTVMPPLPWRNEPVLSPDFVTFVAGEVRAGRCATPLRSAIAVDLAVFVRADGLVRTVVPRAIDCPTVEQFAAGLVTSFARSNLRLPAAGWYRTTITFDWGK